MRKVTPLIAKQSVCLILTNQLRTRLGVAFGDPWTTSGGKAIPFHSSCRIRLKQMGQIKVTNKDTGVVTVAGIKTRAQVVKNRMGPPLKTVDYDIYFESGIDEVGGWLDVMVTYDILKQGGAYYTYKEHKFMAKDFEQFLKDNPLIKEEMYLAICDKYISRYTPHQTDAEVTIAPMNEEDENEEVVSSKKKKKAEEQE
jgi:recombination protein RecA